MSIIPPLDRLTKAPSFGVDKIQQQFNDILDLVVDQTNQTIKDSVKLPTNVKCDDPRVQNIKQNLENIQSLITQVQQNIPKIQSAITAVNTIVSTAQGINAAIAAAQLSNPVTAALFISLQTQAIQNQLIVNAVEAVKPLQSLPTQIESKILTLVPVLITAISKLNTVCGDSDIELNIPNISTESTVTDYNDLVPTEFYNESNVSETDLTQRSDSIEQLVEQQRNLLTSLQEAPSQVYKQEGNPPPELGKIGDYYLNTSNNVSYGPKITDTDWGNPLN
tara:strand:- start:2690 stop:3523 length:834 start_codon:yes stop_codon:yes gene_type:complete